MSFLEKCSQFRLGGKTVAEWSQFSCGDNDLDNFFLNDAANYERQLLGKTYCFALNEASSAIVCAFTLSASSVDVRNIPRSRRDKVTKNIPHEKSLSSYPAVLIGRLGVSSAYRKLGIGSELIEYIKHMSIDPDNLYSCRYLTVDAYNSGQTLKFYETNGFKLLFSSEQQEREYIGLSPERELKTRLMYFDLITV
ncbi:MAG: GNAT family N-acetyltransferase [Prevotellaceae bacterium]|jgi:GNAT superfamily N-acetyltransferase|nr:GNAT family N-acetyltransferase [Prevotellaceae bacterium]